MTSPDVEAESGPAIVITPPRARIRPIDIVGLERVAMITEKPGAVLSSRARTMGSVSAQPSTTW